ncbi:hypothetical protein L1987_35642 [Smallanthus sonchifolius]|uniref:Uncharacterized protein n=1 Tax=Smallanthus sonchifolius TaxID=185202 RepID=A0ACB9HCN1_9ASTR|nr:hypothetical protein L1987_35642 [Smallanthus sonchifolius]
MTNTSSIPLTPHHSRHLRLRLHLSFVNVGFLALVDAVVSEIRDCRQRRMRTHTDHHTSELSFDVSKIESCSRTLIFWKLKMTGSINRNTGQTSNLYRDPPATTDVGELRTDLRVAAIRNENWPLNRFL